MRDERREQQRAARNHQEVRFPFSARSRFKTHPNHSAKKSLEDASRIVRDKAADAKHLIKEGTKDSLHSTAAVVGLVSTPSRQDAELVKWTKVRFFEFLERPID